MDASAMAKLKELVTSRRLRAAEKLLSQHLEQSPTNYTLLMHMGGIQSSMLKYKKAEHYYKQAILSGKRQSGSAKVQLMKIYSQHSRYNDLIMLLRSCLETESKSISLKERLIEVYLEIFEPQSALIYSRQLIEQIKDTNKTKSKDNESQTATTDEQKKHNERAKVLSDTMKQSDLYFVHSQILNKVGRFSDSILYCKKAITILNEWLNAQTTQNRNKILSGKQLNPQYPERMNRLYGYLGLCYVHVDDIDNALGCFKRALNINARDRIAQSNIYNMTHNRTLFEKCMELKKVYQRWIEGKLKDNEVDTVEDRLLEYIQLLSQEKRLFLAKRVCEEFLDKIGYKSLVSSQCVILYEDILRQNMNVMMKNVSDDVLSVMDSKRNSNGPQVVVKEFETNVERERVVKGLEHKIWDIRSKIDGVYGCALDISPHDCNLCVAYCLCLWRIGYDSAGIDIKTSTMSAVNGAMLNESKYYLLRGNAFINDNANECAMIELENALRISMKEKNDSDEIQTRLLMAVTLNKMNKLQEAHTQCLLIMDGNANNEAGLKIYGAILQRMKKYKKSKKIFGRLLKDNEGDITICTEYIHLLIEMKEYDEAKKQLEFVLGLKPGNTGRLQLMYEFGVVCMKMGDISEAKTTFISIINARPLKCEGALVNLINIYNEEIASFRHKLNEIDDNDDISHNKETFLNAQQDAICQCQKYLVQWIDMDSYHKTPYFMYLEHLWAMDKHKETAQLWRQWCDELKNELNQESENPGPGPGMEEKKEKEEVCRDEKSKIRILLSDLYQKYARMLTQTKVVLNVHTLIDDNEDETCNEEIESYFSTSLEYNEENVEALQGFAAYYISMREYIHALPFLEEAKAANKSVSASWIQLARLYETISNHNYKEVDIRRPLDVLKEGLKYIESFKYKNYNNYVSNMVQICEELIEKLILFGGNDSENMKLAEKYCWFILDKLDRLNITAQREISKVCQDRNKIDAFFGDVLSEFPSYVPSLVEYAQFLMSATQDRGNMLMKAQQLLSKAIDVTSSDDGHAHAQSRYRCVAFYILGFVKLHLVQLQGKKDEDKERLNKEARHLFIAAVEADENNVYARINLAQFLAFKDNDNDSALLHLEYAYNNLTRNDPNLCANLIKVLAKKAIEMEDNINMDLLRRAFKLCGTALTRYNGHFGLIVARSSLQNIKKKFNLIELDDGLDDEDVQIQKETERKTLLQPQTTYGMIGVEIMNPKQNT